MPTYSSSQSLHKALKELRSEAYDIAENGASSLADVYDSKQRETTIMPITTKPVLLAASSKEQLLVHLRGQERQLHSQAAAVSKLVGRMDQTMDARGIVNSSRSSSSIHGQSVSDWKSNNENSHNANGADMSAEELARCPLSPVGFARQARAMNKELRLSALLPPTKQSQMYSYLHKGKLQGSLRSMGDNIANYSSVNELLPSQLQLLEYREERRRLTIEKYYLYRVALEQMREWRVRAREFKVDRRNTRAADYKFYAEKVRDLFAFLKMRMHFGAKMVCVVYTRNINLQLYCLQRLKQKMYNFKMVRVVELYLRSNWSLQKGWRMWCVRIGAKVAFLRGRERRSRRAAAQGRNPRGVDPTNLAEVDDFYFANTFRRFRCLCTWSADSKRRSRVHYIRRLYLRGLSALGFNRTDRQETRWGVAFSKRIVKCRYLLRRWCGVAQRRVRCRATDVVYRYNQARRVWRRLSAVFRRKEEEQQRLRWRAYRQGMDSFYLRRALQTWRFFPEFQRTQRGNRNCCLVQLARDKFAKFQARQEVEAGALQQLLDRYKECIKGGERGSNGHSRSRTSSAAAAASVRPRTMSSTAALFADNEPETAGGLPTPALPVIDAFDGSYEEYRRQKRRRNSLLIQARTEGSEAESAAESARVQHAERERAAASELTQLSDTALVEHEIRAQLFRGCSGGMSASDPLSGGQEPQSRSDTERPGFSNRQTHVIVHFYQLVTLLSRRAHQASFARRFLAAKQMYATQQMVRHRKLEAFRHWMHGTEKMRYFNLKFLVAQKSALRNRVESMKRTALRRWVRNAKHHKYEQKLIRQRYVNKQRDILRLRSKMTPEQIERSKSKLLQQQPEKQFGVGKGRRYSVILKDVLPAFVELQALQYVNNWSTGDVVGQWQIDYHIELLQKCTKAGVRKVMRRGMYALERRTVETLRALASYKRSKQFYIDGMLQSTWGAWRHFAHKTPSMAHHFNRVPLGYSLNSVYWRKWTQKTKGNRQVSANVALATEKHRSYQLRTGYQQFLNIYTIFLRGLALKTEGKDARDKLLVNKGMFKLKALVRRIRVERRKMNIMDQTLIISFKLLYVYKRWCRNFAEFSDNAQWHRKCLRRGNAFFVYPRLQRWKAHYNRIAHFGRCVQRGQTFRRRFHQRHSLRVWKAKLDDIDKRQKFLSRVGYEHFALRSLRTIIADWKWRTTSTRIQIIDVDFMRHQHYRSEDSIYWVTIKLRQFIRRMNQNATFFRDRRARRRFTYRKMYSNFMNRLSSYGLSRSICVSSLAVADDYRLRHIGSSVLTHLRHFADNSLVYKYMKTSAKEFRNTRLLRKTFDTWFADMKSCEHLYESADVYYASSGAAKALVAIKSRTQVLDWMLNLEEVGFNGHARYGARTALEHLHHNIIARREDYALNHFGESNYLSRSTFKAFDRWHAIHTAASTRKYKEMECLLHFNSRLIHMGLLCWCHTWERNSRQAGDHSLAIRTYRRKKFKCAMKHIKRHYGPKKQSWCRKLELKLAKHRRSQLRLHLDRVAEFTHRSRHFHDGMQLARKHFKAEHGVRAIRLIRRHKQLGAKKQRAMLPEVSIPHHYTHLTTKYFFKFTGGLSSRIVTKRKREFAVAEMLRFKILRAFFNWKGFKDVRNREKRMNVMTSTAIGKVTGWGKVNKVERMQHRIKVAIAKCSISALAAHSDIVDRERHLHVLFAVRSVFAIRLWKVKTDRKGAAVKEKLAKMVNAMEVITATGVFSSLREIVHQRAFITRGDRHFACFQFSKRFIKRLRSMIRCRNGHEGVTLLRLRKQFQWWRHRRTVSVNAKALVKRVLHQRIYQKQIDMFDEWVLITHIERTLEGYLTRKVQSDKLRCLYNLFQHFRAKKVGRFSRNKLVEFGQRGHQGHLRHSKKLFVCKLKSQRAAAVYFGQALKRGRDGMDRFCAVRVVERLQWGVYRDRMRQERKQLAESLKLRHGLLALDGHAKNGINRRTELHNVDAYRRNRLLQGAWHNLHASIEYRQLDASVSRNWQMRHRRHQLRRAMQQLDALRCARWGERHEERLMDEARFKIVRRVALRLLRRNVLSNRKQRTQQRKMELVRAQRAQKSGVDTAEVSESDAAMGVSTPRPAWQSFTDSDYPEEDDYDDGDADLYVLPRRHRVLPVDIHAGFRKRTVSPESVHRSSSTSSPAHPTRKTAPAEVNSPTPPMDFSTMNYISPSTIDSTSLEIGSADGETDTNGNNHDDGDGNGSDEELIAAHVSDGESQESEAEEELTESVQ